MVPNTFDLAMDQLRDGNLASSLDSNTLLIFLCGLMLIYLCLDSLLVMTRLNKFTLIWGLVLFSGVTTVEDSTELGYIVTMIAVVGGVISTLKFEWLAYRARRAQARADKFNASNKVAPATEKRAPHGEKEPDWVD